MPSIEDVIGLSGYKLEAVVSRRPLVYKVMNARPCPCPRCGGKDRRSKGWFERKVRHGSGAAKPLYLLLKGRKFLCLSCLRQYRERFEAVLPRKRYTEPFRSSVCRMHGDGVSQKTLANRERIGAATVERWYQDCLDSRVKERSLPGCPKLLGIDEHFFTRRQGFATTFCDLGRRKVFDVTLGRSEKALGGYLNSLKDKDKVELVCIDLSESYRSLARKHFPQARIVADRFHVVRLLGERFMRLWRRLDAVGSLNRGLVSLIRRHPRKLKSDQRLRLKEYFQAHPAIEAVYRFKQKLHDLLCRRSQSAKQCRRLARSFASMIEQLKGSGFEEMASLGRTFEQWSEPIACMWRFTKNNAITEGYHNKMEMISRRAFGFRNFNNYRLRVRALCG